MVDHTRATTGFKWNRLVTDLVESGFSYGEAAEWATEWLLPEFPEYLVLDARSYRDAGFCVSEAVKWYLRGVDPKTAVAYVTAGRRPGDATVLRAALTKEHGRPRRRDSPFTDELEWIATSMSAQRMALYVAASLRPPEAAAVDVRVRGGDIDAVNGVCLVAALRCGPH